MARLFHTSATETNEFVAISVDHMRTNIDKSFEIELPYFTHDSKVEGIRINMSRTEALRFAARIVNTVNESYEREN